MSNSSVTLGDLKSQAKSLRKALASAGHEVTHSQSLELLAQQMGHRDWNTLHASVGNAPPVPFHLGQKISGTYLGQAFKGEIISLRSIAENTRFQLTLRFDYPVDVIKFDSMSNFRSQISATVDRTGQTVEKTSDGRPHLVLAMKSSRS